MSSNNTISESSLSISGKIKAYIELTKFRLSFLVVLSAGICYGIGNNGVFNISKLGWLITGGFLVTGASNVFNQMIEKELDKLMNRTKLRPLPTQRVNDYEALMLGLCMGSLGIMILYFLMNETSGILGALAMALYTLAYTPLKRITPFAVFVGAFPGAIPPLIGYVAATNRIDTLALILFGIQFLWQFPHFWSIAWIMDEDYKKAGFKMLPNTEKDKQSALQILIYSFSLIPASFFTYSFKATSIYCSIAMCIASILFAIQALTLYKSLDDKDARKLMFGSFVYLPIIQLAILIDKLI